MIEPDNHTAWVDRFGDTWVRDDEHPGRYGSWWPLLDGPGYNASTGMGIGSARDWTMTVEYGPFTPADPQRTAAALDRVRREVTS